MAGGDGQNHVLSGFVLRARRIAAHSLVQNMAELNRYAKGSITGNVNASGNVTVFQELPASEEAFESLAARLRPITIPSEPIYYKKVLSALRAAASDEDHDRIRELEREWEAAEIQGTQVQAYSLQQSKLGGSEATDFVSDTQLAAAWLYADLIHSNATGPKRAALDFPLVERYSAAVRIFAHMASLTLATFELIQLMIDGGRVTVTSASLDDEVVVTQTQLIRKARAYFAEVGTERPDLRVTSAWPAEWKQFTVTEVKRQDPNNRVEVRLRRNDDTELATYESAIIHRNMESDPAELHVLVGGCTVFKIGLERAAGSFTSGSLLGLVELNDTNALGLSAKRLRLQMHEANSVVFILGGAEVIELNGFILPPQELLQTQVLAEVLEDISVIETIVGEQFALCATRFTDDHRVSLRRSRLLHEGKVLCSSSGPIQVTANGKVPPKAIRSQHLSLNVGGTVVPVPTTLMWHPQVVAEMISSNDESSIYSMSIPHGQCFLEWNPEKFDLQPDFDFSKVAKYHLTGIAEPDNRLCTSLIDDVSSFHGYDR